MLFGIHSFVLFEPHLTLLLFFTGVCEIFTVLFPRKSGSNVEWSILVYWSWVDEVFWSGQFGSKTEGMEGTLWSESICMWICLDPINRSSWRREWTETSLIRFILSSQLPNRNVQPYFFFLGSKNLSKMEFSLDWIDGIQFRCGNKCNFYVIPYLKHIWGPFWRSILGSSWGKQLLFFFRRNWLSNQRAFTFWREMVVS